MNENFDIEEKILKEIRNGGIVSEGVLQTMIENGHLNIDSSKRILSAYKDIKSKENVAFNKTVTVELSDEVYNIINDLIILSIVKERSEAVELFLQRGVKEYSDLIDQARKQKEAIVDIRRKLIDEVADR